MTSEDYSIEIIEPSAPENRALAAAFLETADAVAETQPPASTTGAKPLLLQVHRTVKSALTRQDAIALVARSGERVIGLAVGFEHQPAHCGAQHSIFLSGLIVHRAHRRRGVGKRLGEGLIEEGRSRGARAVLADVPEGDMPTTALAAALKLQPLMVRMTCPISRLLASAEGRPSSDAATISALQSNEEDALVELFRPYGDELRSYDPHFYDDAVWERKNREFVRLAAHHPARHALVAWRAGEIVGALLGQHSPVPAWVQPPTAYLMDAYVAPTERGMGTRQALVQAFASRLARHDVRSVDLTVYVANTGACAFWSRMGFQRTHTIHRRMLS